MLLRTRLLIGLVVAIVVVALVGIAIAWHSIAQIGTPTDPGAAPGTPAATD